MCIDEQVCSGDHPEQNKKPIHVYHRTARAHQAERKYRQKQLGLQIIAVCYVYVFMHSLIWISRGLSPNHNLVFIVACGLEICKGVLSLPFVDESGQDMCEITCTLVSHTKPHDCANPSILLACTSNDPRNVCFTSKSTERYNLETQRQVQH